MVTITDDMRKTSDDFKKYLENRVDRSILEAHNNGQHNALFPFCTNAWTIYNEMYIENDTFHRELRAKYEANGYKITRDPQHRDCWYISW